MYDLVITDLVMNGVDGLKVLKKTKELNPETMVIILTGFADLDSAIEALRLNADDYLLKPCETEEMSFRVRRCFERQDINRRLKVYEKILPVCCVCKKIRDDTGTIPGQGKWMEMEDYIHKKAGIQVTSTYCPECADEVNKEIEGM